MRKILLLSLFTATSILAQTEPHKSPPLGNTPAPDLKKSDKPNEGVVPPAPAAETTSNGTTTSPNDKNPPPFDVTNMDTSVKPGDDFFMYANGGWIKRTQIPPEYSRWGSFNQLIEKNNDALHEIAEKASRTKVDPKTAPEVQKVGDYYASGMDEKTIEQMRAKPLHDELAKIDGMKDRNDLLKEIAHLHSIGVNVLFGFGSGIDDKNSQMTIANRSEEHT